MIGITKETPRLHGYCDDCNQPINDAKAVILSGFSEKNHPMRNGQWATVQLHEHCARLFSEEMARELGRL